MKMVLDASVALSWLLEDAGAGHKYAGAVFDALAGADAEARVPATWGLEVANVIAKSELRDILPRERSQVFLAALAAAPIVCDSETYSQTLADTLDLSRRFRLSAYDASYLELALRTTLPLATLDTELQRAANKAGAQLFKLV
jgi:predicted nucleic acid-binding protein